jgi:hypothetical protein
MNTVQQYIAAIDAVRSDMDKWLNLIPPKFRPGSPFHAENGTSTFMILRLHCVYHALVISLCRLELHVGTEECRLASTKKQLMNTARTVIQLTRYIDLKPYTPLW